MISDTTSRYESLVYGLCAEIDYLDGQLKNALKQEQYWKEKYDKLINQNISDGYEAVGITLKTLLLKVSA